MTSNLFTFTAVTRDHERKTVFIKQGFPSITSTTEFICPSCRKTAVEVPHNKVDSYGMIWKCPMPSCGMDFKFNLDLPRYVIEDNSTTNERLASLQKTIEKGLLSLDKKLEARVNHLAYLLENIQQPTHRKYNAENTADNAIIARSMAEAHKKLDLLQADAEAADFTYVKILKEIRDDVCKIPISSMPQNQTLQELHTDVSEMKQTLHYKVDPLARAIYDILLEWYNDGFSEMPSRLQSIDHSLANLQNGLRATNPGSTQETFPPIQKTRRKHTSRHG